MDRKLSDSGLTPGAYFWERLLNQPHYRVKQNLVLRDKYIEEYDRIMQLQKKHHPLLNDSKTFDALVKSFIPNNKAEQNKWKSGTITNFVRNYILYYQRPLKSQRGLLDTCRFEEGYKEYDTDGNLIVNRPAYVMPISAPLFQEFRVWQDLGHLGFKDSLGNTTLLSNSEKEILYRKLRSVGELTQASVYKLLEKDKKKYPELNRPDDKPLLGNKTLNLLKKVLSKVNSTNLHLLEDDEEVLEKIWHLLFSVVDHQARRKSLIKNFGFTPEEAAALMTVNFEKGYSNLSAKAVKKLLPLMRSGLYYIENDVSPETIARIQDFTNGVISEGDEKKLAELLKDKACFRDFQGLKYWEAAFVVYGSHSSAGEIERYQSFEEIKRLPLHSLRNPVVEQVVNEALMLMKDIWKHYGRPDEVVVELAREMKMTADDRKKMTKAIGDNERDRNRVAKILQGEDFKMQNPSNAAILKYQLWIQQNFECMYSGLQIQKADLFSGAVDVDHVLPKQRYFDDSQNNKVLAFRRENQLKLNKTAYEYMNETGRWETFKTRVDELKKARKIKQQKYNYLIADKIPEDFVKRQLQETRYIAVQMTNQLKRIAPRVRSSNGSITDHLKQSWRLNEVFKEVQLARFERLQKLYPEIDWIKREKDANNHDILNLYAWDKRIDHRHHALDAIIIACTTYSMVNQLNRLNALYGQLEKEGKRARHFPLPFTGFYARLKDVLANMVVSIKCTDKLATKALNRITKLDPETQRYYNAKQESKGWAVRGPLHDEQPLGQITRQEKMPVAKVLDKIALNPTLLNETDKNKRFFAVDWQRETIKKNLALYRGDVAKMKKNLSKMPVINDYGLAITHVTVFNSYYSRTRSLDAGFSLEQASNIIDVKLKNDVLNFLKQWDNDPKKAFTSDNLLFWNSKREVPIYRIACFVDKVKVGESESRKRHSDMHGKDYNKFVSTSSGNYGIVIEQNIATSKRTAKAISFYDAVRMKVLDIPLIQKNDGLISFLLRINSLVYVPLPEENLHDLKNIGVNGNIGRFYRVVQLSGNRCYFIPAFISKAMKFNVETLGIEIQEYKSQSSTEFHGDDSDRLKIINCCFPVQIDRLGKIQDILTP
jgi:CRISPR-associated endonuclease Csn1